MRTLIIFALFPAIASAQIFNPASVVHHRNHKIKLVKTSAYQNDKGLQPALLQHYNRQGFLVKQENLQNDGVTLFFNYEVNAKDSSLKVSRKTVYPSESNQPEKQEQFIYYYQNGKLIEWTVTQEPEFPQQLKVYHYDNHWNLIALEELQVNEKDTTVNSHQRYLVSTDARHRLLKSRQQAENITRLYQFNYDDELVKTMLYDGPVKRQTTYRNNNERGLPVLTVVVNKRSGLLTAMRQFTYRNYWWTNPSILEQWQPVVYFAAVMPPR